MKQIRIIIVLISFNFSVGQNLITELRQNWNGSSWDNSFKISNTYDDNNYLIHTFSESWNSAVNDYQNNGQSTITNNSDGTSAVIISQLWNSSTNEWNQPHRVTNTYNSTGKLIEQLEESWSNSTSNWVNYWKFSRTYDDNDNLILIETQPWDGSSWKNYNQFVYVINSDGTTNSQLYQSWNYSVWDNETLYEYTYNDSSLRETSIGKYWSNNTWINGSKIVYSYDAENKLDGYLYYNWDNILSDWKLSANMSITYNSYNLPNEVLYQVWNSNSSTWVNNNRYIYIYDSTLNLSEISIDKFKIYPNPSSNYVIINSPTHRKVNFSIYNNLGQFILSDGFTDSYKLYLDNFSNGIYFINIVDKNKVMTKKLIVNK
jgi:Secretion system C-terminal sorting domain